MVNISAKEDIVQLIKSDNSMMDILRIVQSLKLPDCWVCAGFIRNKVWDTLHGFEKPTPLDDVDVIYFDLNNIDENVEKIIEETLRGIKSNSNWSVKNQARMYIRNGDEPYKSSVEAISKFPETATAIGVRLDTENNVDLTTPCGIEDLLNLVVRPTTHFRENASKKARIYEERLEKKKWEQRWYSLKVVHMM